MRTITLGILVAILVTAAPLSGIFIWHWLGWRIPGYFGLVGIIVGLFLAIPLVWFLGRGENDNGHAD